MEFLDVNLMVDEAVKDHTKIRKIVSLLYDEDMTRRLTAARALGELAKREPELMQQRWERIFRSFDDTMSCWGAAEALGELARNMPHNRGRITLFMRVFRKDDCSCQGYIWGMCRVCQVDRERIHDFAPELEGFLNSPHICLRGQALWALGELRIKEAATRMKDLLRDEGEIWYYGNETAESKKISMIAEEALKKLATP